MAVRKYYTKRKPKHKYAKAYKKFFKFCIDNKVELLSDDERYIIKCVDKTAKNEHEAKCLLYEYFKKFTQGVKEQACEIKKQNSGRRMANLYLLQFII